MGWTESACLAVVHLVDGKRRRSDYESGGDKYGSNVKRTDKQNTLLELPLSLSALISGKFQNITSIFIVSQPLLYIATLLTKYGAAS